MWDQIFILDFAIVGSMTMMMPSDIEEFGTEGEKAFYKFLEGVAKPDAHYLCWYLPEINGNEPDFLLYGEDVGRLPSY